MDLVRNTSRYADMTADVAFLSSESLSLRLRTSAEGVWNTSLFLKKKSIPIKRNNNPTDRASGMAN